LTENLSALVLHLEEHRLLFEKIMAELDPETLKKASLAKDPSSCSYGIDTEPAEND
jgi:hypothetical protein